MSRTIEKRFIMGEREKEYFVELMRNLAQFSGLRILTYSIMSNHFHILLQCPQREDVSDRLLLKRLRAIYPAKKVAEIAAELTQRRQSGEHDAAEALKSGFTYRMYDISAYFKSLKQEFSQWYNRRNDRTGPLWDQRFLSKADRFPESSYSAAGCVTLLMALQSAVGPLSKISSSPVAIGLDVVARMAREPCETQKTSDLSACATCSYRPLAFANGNPVNSPSD